MGFNRNTQVDIEQQRVVSASRAPDAQIPAFVIADAGRELELKPGIGFDRRRKLGAGAVDRNIGRGRREILGRLEIERGALGQRSGEREIGR